MAVAPLTFDPSALFEETKQGAYVYDGSPSGYHQWEFYTRLKVTAAKMMIKLLHWRKWWKVFEERPAMSPWT